MKKVFFLLLIVQSLSCHQKKYEYPHVVITSSLGEIELELYPGKAPKTVAAFLGYVREGIYGDASFYRVLKNDGIEEKYNSGLVQGGLYKTNPSRLSKLPGIEHESPKQTGISHLNGTISLARTLPGTASSEFFICIGDQTQFDSSKNTHPDALGYAAFGKVVTGMAVLRKIQSGPNSGDQIISPVKIVSIKELE